MFVYSHSFQKWTGPTQYENPDGSLMMLPADLSLAKAPEFRPYVELYAKDEQKFFNDFAATFGKVLF
jgi:cytochrome c peroxidase